MYDENNPFRKCPVCERYMDFKMVYVAGTPSAQYYCASCGFNASRNVKTSYSDKTDFIKDIIPGLFNRGLR